MDADPREAKLPKWAQEELAQMRRRVEDAERAEREARLASGPEDSDTLIDPYNEVPIRLGRRTSVRFMPAGPSATHNWIDAQVTREGTLRIMAENQLVVAPQVTNVVNVWVKER